FARIRLSGPSVHVLVELLVDPPRGGGEQNGDVAARLQVPQGDAKEVIEFAIARALRAGDRRVRQLVMYDTPAIGREAFGNAGPHVHQHRRVRAQPEPHDLGVVAGHVVDEPHRGVAVAGAGVDGDVPRPRGRGRLPAGEIRVWRDAPLELLV